MTKNSKHVVHFMLAVRRRIAREGGQAADFLPITAWGPLADFCTRFLKKGQQISVVGRSQSSTWQDIEGKKRYSVDIVADEIHFADSRRQEANHSEGAEDTDNMGDVDDLDPDNLFPEVTEMNGLAENGSH